MHVSEEYVVGSVLKKYNAKVDCVDACDRVHRWMYACARPIDNMEMVNVKPKTLIHISSGSGMLLMGRSSKAWLGGTLGMC